MADEEKENIASETEDSETESSKVSDEENEESLDESSEDTTEEETEDEASEETEESEESSEETPNEEGGDTSNGPTPEQVKGYKRNITGLGIALGVLILLAAMIVVALIVRGMNEDTTCTDSDTCEVCEVCTENVESEIAPYMYADAIENK